MARKVALVLSGGGARGAFQFGALKYIREQILTQNQAFDYDLIAGVSVGALNGVMLAMDKFNELEVLWNTLTNGDVYQGKIDLFHSVWKIIRGKKAILDNDPLRQLLSRHLFLADLQPRYQFRCGAVTLLDGMYQVFHGNDFDIDTDFRNAVLASSAMPLAWPPVATITNRNQQTYHNLVDGGIRNINPLGDVLEDDPGTVIIINCNSKSLLPDPKATKNLINIARRALVDIAVNEIFNSDINEFLRINHIVKQAQGKGLQLYKDDAQSKPYRYYQCIIIDPTEDLGDSLDFSRSSIDFRIALGQKVAKLEFAKLVESGTSLAEFFGADAS